MKPSSPSSFRSAELPMSQCVKQSAFALVFLHDPLHFMGDEGCPPAAVLQDNEAGNFTSAGLFLRRFLLSLPVSPSSLKRDFSRGAGGEARALSRCLEAHGASVLTAGEAASNS